MDIRERELIEAVVAGLTRDRQALRESLRLVLDRLREVPSEDDGRTVAHGGFFSSAEVEHLRALLEREAPS